MMIFLDTLTGTLIQGLVYALVSLGVYITYSILDFPDLGVDGTFPMGAAITAVLLLNGTDPYVCLILAAATGAIAGLVTGVIHVIFKVRNLLAGIITMTALSSINLLIGGSNLTVDRSIDTVFSARPVMALLGGNALTTRKLCVALVLVILVKILMDAYFRTRSGLLLRAVGDNPDLVTSLAKDRGMVKILGLMIANALVALGGSMACQEQRSYSATMGTGQLVYGLAAVIIGVSLFRFYENTPVAQSLAKKPALHWLGAPRGTTAVIIGSILYKLCVQIAMSAGLPANMMKLVTAVLFLLVLIVSGRKGEEIIHA